MKEPEPIEQKVKEGGKSKKPIMILLAIIALAGVANFLGLFPGEKQVAELSPPQVEEFTKKPLEPFTVNLADPNFRRYLRVQVTLEYTGKELEEELEEKYHRMRDAIITTLRSKMAADLGNDVALREELLTTVNSVLVNGKITGIYFGDFIVQ
ncbi:MAG: flagellar basal body-associated FliL family protein [Bacillota bacterium]